MTARQMKDNTVSRASSCRRGIGVRGGIEGGGGLIATQCLSLPVSARSIARVRLTAQGGQQMKEDISPKLPPSCPRFVFSYGKRNTVPARRHASRKSLRRRNDIQSPHHAPLLLVQFQLALPRPPKGARANPSVKLQHMEFDLTTSTGETAAVSPVQSQLVGQSATQGLPRLVALHR